MFFILHFSETWVFSFFTEKVKYWFFPQSLGKTDMNDSFIFLCRCSQEVTLWISSSITFSSTEAECHYWPGDLKAQVWLWDFSCHHLLIAELGVSRYGTASKLLPWRGLLGALYCDSTEVQTSSENHDVGFLPGIFAVQPLRDITELEFLTVLAVLQKHKPMFNNLRSPGAREIPQTEHSNQTQTFLNGFLSTNNCAWQGDPTHWALLSCPSPRVVFAHQAPQGCGLFAQPARTSRDGAAGKHGTAAAAWVSQAFPIFCRDLLNLNILKQIQELKPLPLMAQQDALPVFILVEHRKLCCREALVQIQLVRVLYVCPKCLERIQGNLQTFSQIDVFLRAGVSHGALTCWGRKEIK